jgi:four helix bundle protein
MGAERFRARLLSMETKPHLPIDKMDFFAEFQAVADWSWDWVEKMKPLHMWTFGKQLVTAADAVCANLIEGGNRYTDPDQVHFFIIARASAQETIYWIRRAVRQSSIEREEGRAKVREVVVACKKLNGLIAYRRANPLKVREGVTVYDEQAYDGGIL